MSSFRRQSGGSPHSLGLGERSYTSQDVVRGGGVMTTMGAPPGTHLYSSSVQHYASVR
eukprot:NODE_4476_length_346_cov_260.356902_g3873_i0.p2 GENE.NODE_4476_length_346_cov_260.356902_g3873_i0~~NODE_4476_length_346_cov_260.356902_g3873_i0.p2  ORF type:complete len:58 (+),score=1.28 NODE_4476_length_346_cov_260.356902_g3873_i0:113-286(+)